MKAYASVSGGVIFVPDEIERKKKKPTSYRDMLEEKMDVIKAPIFGKKKQAAPPRKVAA